MQPINGYVQVKNIGEPDTKGTGIVTKAKTNTYEVVEVYMPEKVSKGDVVLTDSEPKKFNVLNEDVFFLLESDIIAIV